MQRAFAAGAVTAIICPLIGVFLVPRRLSLIADTLAHVALAGVAVGLLLGASPVLGALVVTVIGALGMERLRARGALQGDAALAVFPPGGFAIGTSFRRATIVAIAMALASVAIGLTAAYYLRLAAGGAVVLTALLIFAVASMLRRLPWTRRPRKLRS